MAWSSLISDLSVSSHAQNVIDTIACRYPLSVAVLPAQHTEMGRSEHSDGLSFKCFLLQVISLMSVALSYAMHTVIKILYNKSNELDSQWFEHGWVLCRSIEDSSEMICTSELARLMGVVFNSLLWISHIFSSSLSPVCAHVKLLAVLFFWLYFVFCFFTVQMCHVVTCVFKQRVLNLHYIFGHSIKDFDGIKM